MFDWSKKRLGPPGIAPEFCPLCGKKMVERLWIYFKLYNNEYLRCLACQEQFDLRIVKHHPIEEA